MMNPMMGGGMLSPYGMGVSGPDCWGFRWKHIDGVANWFLDVIRVGTVDVVPVQCMGFGRQSGGIKRGQGREQTINGDLRMLASKRDSEMRLWGRNWASFLLSPVSPRA